MRYLFIPTVILNIPDDVIDPAARYAAMEAYHAATARCADRSARCRRDAEEVAAWTIDCVGGSAFLRAGTRRVRAAI